MKHPIIVICLLASIVIAGSYRGDDPENIEGYPYEMDFCTTPHGAVLVWDAEALTYFGSDGEMLSWSRAERKWTWCGPAGVIVGNLVPASGGPAFEFSRPDLIDDPELLELVEDI